MENRIALHWRPLSNIGVREEYAKQELHAIDLRGLVFAVQNSHVRIASGLECAYSQDPRLLFEFLSTFRSQCRACEANAPAVKNILLLILFTAAGVCAQAEQGTLAVAVRSESGRPVSQVEVRSGDQVVLTDDRGEATL